MIGAWLAVASAVLSVLFAGLAIAEGRRGAVLARAGGPPDARRRRHGSRAWLGSPFLPPACAVTGWAAAAPVAGPAAAALVAVGGAALPVIVRRRRRGRRQRHVEEQLIDAVAILASAVRTGRSLAQALELAGSEVGEPLGTTLSRLVDRMRLGVPLEDALALWEEELGEVDTRTVTGVLRLHRRIGGALASALEELGRTLRARLSGERELRGLTAQARLSAAILGSLPFGFFLFLSLVSRRDIESAYRTTAGAVAIGVGFALQGLAFLWIRHLLRVERT